jgi:hypothetical protein
MTLIRLAGGLGNQIFQVVAGLLLISNIKSTKITFDDSALNLYDAKRENDLLRFFDFTKLGIEINFCNSIFTKSRLSRVLPLKFSKSPLVSDKNFQKILKNPNKKFLLLDGYFQKSLTQEIFDTEVKILKDILIQKDLEKKDGCVVHIRGGDFVRLGWNSVCSKEYYVKSINIMKEKYTIKKFFLVTDDREYSRSVFKDVNFDYEFIGSNIEEDFYLIGLFEKRILSSSTFAFWASALADNDKSVVIAPEYWSPNSRREIRLPNEIRI